MSKREPLTVIIPAFNEESCIGEVIKQTHETLSRCKIPHEIIVVDDSSEDKTFEKAREYGAHAIRHTVNRGYGAALKTGVRAAQHDLIVITDADGTYPIDKIPLLAEKMTDADMVVGARLGQKVAIPVVRRPAKWILRRLAEYIVGQKIPDLNSGLRAFRRETIIHYLQILPDSFSFTTTITVAMLYDNCAVEYVPIDYYRREGKSKIVPWNFFEFVTLVMRLSMLFNPLKIFVPAATITFLFGGLKLLFDMILALKEAGGITFSFITSKVISASALILIIAGLQILLIGMMADGITRKIGHHMPSRLKSSMDDR